MRPHATDLLILLALPLIAMLIATVLILDTLGDAYADNHPGDAAQQRRKRR